MTASEPAHSTDPTPIKDIQAPGAPPALASERADTQRVLIEAIQVTTHIGPLPSPEVLAAYDRIRPGLAAEIVAMAHSGLNQRMQMQEHQLDAQVSDAIAGRRERARGQWLGFVIVLVGLGVALTVTLKGHDFVGGIIGGSTLVGLAAVFVLGRVLRPGKRDVPD